MFLIKRLDILKNFLASSSELSCKSMFKYSKYLPRFVYSFEVTFKICVIPDYSKYFVLSPETKSP